MCRKQLRARRREMPIARDEEIPHIDATCQKREYREQLRRIAAAHGVPCYLFITEAPEEVIRRRLAERVRQGTSISDGRWEIYLRQKEEFEPVVADEGEALVVDSSTPLHDAVDLLLSAMGLLR